MQITRSDSDTRKGPADWFTGDVYIDAVAAPAGTSRSPRPPCISRPVRARRGTRTRTPGENHWHGAAPNRFMVHIAMQQNDESGNPVNWGEHVTDAQYAAAP